MDFKNTSWIRKSLKKTRDTYNFSQEILKLRNEFNNVNLKTSLTFKTLDTLCFKSRVYKDNLLGYHRLNESDTSIVMPEYANEELKISNDISFKLNVKSQPMKHTSFKRQSKENGKCKTNELLNLNKDINENNEDIFRVTCMTKHFKQEEVKAAEVNTTMSSFQGSPSPSTTSAGDLQKLLVMMPIRFSPTELEEHCGDDNINNIDSDNVVSNNFSNRAEIDTILRITPIKFPISEKEQYLMEKFVNKWKEFVKHRKNYIDEQRQNTLDIFFDKVATKKMHINQFDRHEHKAKHLLRDFNTYQHRYRIQKHIIALQKVKLEEQNRIIEELKYNKIIEASRQSVDAMKEEVRRAYYELDRQLKPKIKCLTKELKIADIKEPSLVLHCLKVPQFLQRMEKRAREREEKHAMIRERRRQMEEERIRLKQQAELAKAEMDKEEKIRRLKDLKEKRKKEKVEIIRKKQWCERLRGLIVMADLHYEKTLKSKYGIAPLRILLAIKRDNIEKARAHYEFQLKNSVFLHWMWYTEDMCFERNYKAEDFSRKLLLGKVFQSFKMLHYNVVLRKQVADDYYDLYLTQLAFRMLYNGIKIIRKENELKWQKAVAYHSSNLLFKAFIYWRTLPALNALKREQEARKARWREKVLQVVPDYTPPDD